MAMIGNNPDTWQVSSGQGRHVIFFFHLASFTKLLLPSLGHTPFHLTFLSVSNNAKLGFIFE